MYVGGCQKIGGTFIVHQTFTYNSDFLCRNVMESEASR